MTLLFLEGFETASDETDISARNLVNNYNYGNNGDNSLVIPSRTGYPGKAMFLRGPYISANSGPMYGPNYTDFGMFQTNQSVYSLWQAGGFSVGFSAGFNAQNFLEIAPGESQQLVYDGSLNYWAIFRNSNTTAWGVAYSPDLKNWTPVITQPPNGVNQNSTITVNGTGLNAIVIVGSSSNYSVPATMYTNNMGLTWTNMAVANSSYRTPVYLNGSTAMYVSVLNGASSVPYPAYATTMTGAAVALSAVGAIAPTSTIEGGYCKLVGNYIVAVSFTGGTAQYQPSAGCTSGIAFCLANADPTVAANWTRTPTLPFEIIDVAYFNGNFVAVGYGGAYYISAATPTIWMPALGITNGAWSMFAVATNGSTLVAVGQDYVNTSLGALYISTDGIHWTKINRFFNAMPANGNTAYNAFTCVIWDGHQFVVTGGLQNGMIITSVDALAWEVQFVTDYPEYTGVNDLSFLGVYSGTLSAANLFSPWSTAAGASNFNGWGIAASTPNGTTRQVGLMQNYGASTVAWLGGTAGANLTTNAPTPVLGLQPGASLTNYYELVFTATGVANQFTLQWAFNGVVQPYTSAAFQLAPAADTVGTNQLFINMPRNGNFNVIDDIYLTNMNGLGNSGRAGPQNIFALKGAAVAKSQFSNSIGSNNNLQTVNTELSNAEGYLYSATTGTQDLYSTSNNVPPNFNVNAVQVDAFLSSQGTGLQVAGTVGIVSGSASKASAPTVAGAGWQTRATLLTETDPNTSAAFTNSALNALELSITKTS